MKQYDGYVAQVARRRPVDLLRLAGGPRGRCGALRALGVGDRGGRQGCQRRAARRAHRHRHRSGGRGRHPGAGVGAAGLAVGEAPNLAARLQSMARPNEVLVAHATRSLVGDAFDLIDLGTVPLAGLGPSRVWRVDAVRRAAGRFDAAHGGAPLGALVGRTEEVAQLLRNWHLAASGSGRVVLIGGEAGIGKSRLAEVLRERIAANRTSPSGASARAFHLRRRPAPRDRQPRARGRLCSRGQLRAEARQAGNNTGRQQTQRAESAPLLAALLSLPTERYAPLGLSAQQQREKTLDALIGQVEALSQMSPVLLVIEDAHWIDPTSQELVDALVQRLPALRIMQVRHLPATAQRVHPSLDPSAHATTMTLTGLATRRAPNWLATWPRARRCPPTCSSRSSCVPTACRCTSRS